MRDVIQFVALLILGAPPFALVLLTLARFSTKDLSEARIQQLTSWIFGVGMVGAIALACALLTLQSPRIIVDLGSVLSLRSYHFDLAMELTPTTLTLLILTFLLSTLVSSYSSRYLHRDPGFFRFYVLLILFAFGMELIVTAHSLTLLFAGWEFVGMTSAILIAFYNERRGPSRHGLRAYATYRATDIGLLLAVAILEYTVHSAEFERLGEVSLPPATMTLVAFLIIFGAMGKGGILPFTGWLPKAMEGPTPSSAIFYGALSVHASPYLLIRSMPLIERVPEGRVVIVVLGCLTAIYATAVGRTRADIKTALAYASCAQVALIWVEVGLGFEELALVHIVGHAVLRTWQLLRSPSILVDFAGTAQKRRASTSLGAWFYRHSLAEWHLDDVGKVLILRPIGRFLRLADALDSVLRRSLGAGDDRGGIERLSSSPEKEQDS
ncbi:MAG: NADH-quinone oxidoreductase subunit L [Polyangiales bacterium]|jgi:NADH-quinone oxidoreductase subunit L